MDTIHLDDLDRAIVKELSRNGRMSNKELAARLGTPPSTCHLRLRRLETSGVIVGYRAETDPAASGQTVEALIFIASVTHARDQVPQLLPHLATIPGVRQVYFIGGDHDFVLHVACESVPALRDLIREHIAADPRLGSTRTQIVFDRAEGSAPLG